MKEIRLAASDAVGVYALAAMMEHSCMPNIKMTFDKQFNVSSDHQHIIIVLSDHLSWSSLWAEIKCAIVDHGEGSTRHLWGRTPLHYVHSRSLGNHRKVQPTLYLTTNEAKYKLSLSSLFTKYPKYHSSIIPLSARRDHLAMTKNFWCNCSRCCDATEFGSNISTIFDRSLSEYPCSSDFRQLRREANSIANWSHRPVTNVIHIQSRLPSF